MSRARGSAAKLPASSAWEAVVRSTKSLIVIALLLLGTILWNRFAPNPPVSETGSAQVATHQTNPKAVIPTAPQATKRPAFLPAEASGTLELIAHGGPFPHRQDGVVFENREHRLPERQRGYYHEYTVETPGLEYRGARRIITGGNPPVEYYYTDDHYRTFRPFQVTP